MKKGTFINKVKVEWMDNPREMKLLDIFIYVDSNGAVWRALKNDIINGASIPRFLWQLIGSPFVGLYRKASVIHDVYCTDKTRSYKDVHECFNEMMFTDGVGKFKRKLMSQAVKKFGPRW